MQNIHYEEKYKLCMSYRSLYKINDKVNPLRRGDVVRGFTNLCKLKAGVARRICASGDPQWIATWRKYDFRHDDAEKCHEENENIEKEEELEQRKVRDNASALVTWIEIIVCDCGNTIMLTVQLWKTYCFV